MSQYRTHGTDEDADLAVAWRNGDISSFETLMRKYQNRLFNIAFRITGSYQDACEVLRQVCGSAYRAGDYLASGQIRCFEWLTGLVIAHCRNRYEPVSLARGGESQSGGGAPEGRHHGPAHDSAHERRRLERLSMHDRLQDCIGMLPGEFREVIVLRDVQGLPYDEISAILRIMPATVMTRMVRAREMVRDCLKQGGGEVAAHAEIRHKFSAYLENTLTTDEKEEIKRHLGGCGLCREELANLEWTVGHLTSLPAVESPSWLFTKILEGLQAPIVAAAPPSDLRQLFLPPLRTSLQIGIATFVILCAAIYFLARTTGPRPLPSLSPTESPLSAGAQPAPVRKAGTLPGLPDPVGAVRPAASVPSDVPQQRPDAAQHASAPQAAVAALPARLSEEPQLQSADEDNETEPEGIHLRSREKRPALALALPREKSAADRAPSSGELDVTLRVNDSAAAAGAIENAVSRLGGRVTGRAHSGGVDLLYTQIDGRKYPELIDRLGRVGKIQDRPQSPEGGIGTIDLVIRW